MFADLADLQAKKSSQFVFDPSVNRLHATDNLRPERGIATGSSAPKTADPSRQLADSIC